MNFLKKLFGATPEVPGEEQRAQEARDFDVLKYDGVAALRQNAYDYAIKCFGYALDMRDDAETRDYLAQALIHANRMPEAFAQLERLAETEPDNVRILLRMSDVAYMMEDYDAMTDVCERANAIDSENALVNYSYAKARIGKADVVNAIALLSKAVVVAKDTPFYDAYLLRGQTLLRMNEVAAAMRDADFLVERLPDSEDALLLKARCAEADGDHDTALQTYGAAIELNPFQTDAFRERAVIRMALGDEQGAAEDIKAVDELMGDMAEGSDGMDGEEDFVRRVEQSYKSANPFG